MIWTQLLLQHFFASSILKQAQLHQVVLQIICPTVSCEDATVTTNSNMSLNCKYLHLPDITVVCYYSCLILQLSDITVVPFVVHDPTLCPKGTQTPPKWTTPHNCWQNISNTNTYLRNRYPPSEQHPTNVGRIYPIQIHISENVHTPTLCPKGTQTPPNWTTFHNCWQYISNI